MRPKIPKPLALAVIIATLFFVFSPLARGILTYAESATPHIVVSGKVYLEGEDGTKLFRLPDGYYIKINNLDEKYYYVTFNGVSGRVSKNLVSTTGYAGATVSTTATLGVNQEFLDFVGINLKKSPAITSETVLSIPTTASFIYIGDYLEGEKVWYYIRYEQYYGYLQADRTSEPNHIVPTFVPQEEQPVDTPSEPGTSVLDKLKEGGSLRTVIIIGLAVPVVLIILLIFKPGKKYDSDE